MAESFDWQHGTFLGASVASETTAAAAGATGALRHDPFAMLPFCGYHMGDYIGHWLEMGRTAQARGEDARLPRLYYVNWFRKGPDGRWLWPGFGENSRVLKWIVERLEGTAEGVETPIGVLPTADALDLEGLDLPARDLELLLSVDREVWRQEAELMPEYFAQFGERLPQAISDEIAALSERLTREG